MREDEGNVEEVEGKAAEEEKDAGAAMGGDENKGMYELHFFII